jgi:kinesin family member 5
MDKDKSNLAASKRPGTAAAKKPDPKQLSKRPGSAKPEDLTKSLKTAPK